MALTIRGRNPTSVFQLLGSDENSATFALGWVLERCPCFRRAIIAAIFGNQVRIANAVITLQTHANDGGFTDLELQDRGRVHVILEAKRGWNLPTLQQLQRYQPRLITGGAAVQRFVSVSSMTAAHARRQLPHDLGGIEIIHLSWHDLQRSAKRAHSSTTKFEEKLWLRQFIDHMREFVAMERITNNLVFVVALGRTPLVAGTRLTTIRVLEESRYYFHPIKARWPRQPPNYMGFRYGGRLQSVHHVDSFEIITNLAEFNNSWPETQVDHFVYKLGPPMKPVAKVVTGYITRNDRVWCAIDTLLSGAFRKISTARDETQRRTNQLTRIARQ